VPKKIDPKVKERCVQQMLEHANEYPNPTAAAEAVARRNGVAIESVRRWYVLAQIDGGGQRHPSPGLDFLRGGARPPRSLIVAFIDECRQAGHAVESICRVLTEQGCQIAARTYRLWTCPQLQAAARTVSDAIVMDKVRDLAWTVDTDGELAGVRRLTPEGLYGRRKMTKLVRRSLPEATPGAVDRAMKALDLKGIRRSKGVRTTIPGKDGRRAGDLLNRDFTAAAPNRTWVMDFTYCRTWAGFAYVAFIVDVFAQKIVGWHCATSKDVELIMTPLRMATWQRQREGRPVVPGELIGHADAGSQYTSIRFTEHLDLEGIRPSIGSVGDAYDNALMESVIGLFKTECIRTTVFHAGPYRGLADVEWATAGWVDWYNNRRLHSSLDYLTPEEFEQAHYAAISQEPQPV
jgi:putative transposase